MPSALSSPPRPTLTLSALSYLSLVTFSFLLSLPDPIRAFTFAFNDTNAATCDMVEVSWRGGSPPFHLLIIPSFDYPSKHSISNDNWNGETGVYNWRVNYPPGTGYVAVMSDSGGIATGGVSSIMQVDKPITNSSTCAIREAVADGFFFLDPQDGDVGQCQDLGIGWTSNVTNPTLLGVIPNGNAFLLPITTSPWKWPVNVVGENSPFILAMLSDGPYGQAGSSNFLSVNHTKDEGTPTCLDAASPSRTPGSQWGKPGGVAATTQKSATATATSTPVSSSSPQSRGSGLSTALIVGISVAGVLAVAACQGIFFWFCCRNRFRRTLASNPVDLFSSKHEGESVGDAPVASRSRFFGRDRDRDLSAYQPEPYLHVAVGSADQLPSPSSATDLTSAVPNHRDDQATENPFDDDGGYLYAGMVRRGSGVAADSGGSSPSQSGIHLRSLSSSQPSPFSPRHPYRPFPPQSDSQGERLLSHNSPSSPSYDSYSSPTYVDSPTSTSSPSHFANFSHSHSAHRSQLHPISTSTPPPRSLSPSASAPPSPSMSSTPSMVRNTKQMLALSNPDRELTEDTGPGPSFVRHADAGPMEEDGPGVARTGETVELPPLYDDLQPRRS